MDLSKIAYEAYATALGGKVPETESPLPSFQDLPEEMKGAWNAVAEAVKLNVIQEENDKKERP